MENEKPQPETLPGYWNCPKCGMANRPENQTCYFKCELNESLVQRPPMLTEG